MMSTSASSPPVSRSRHTRSSRPTRWISALALVCSLALPAAALRADTSPARFAVQAAEVQPRAEAGRFSVLAQPRANAAAPRFQLIGAKSAQTGSACEQVDALFMDGFED